MLYRGVGFKWVIIHFSFQNENTSAGLKNSFRYYISAFLKAQVQIHDVASEYLQRFPLPLTFRQTG